MEKSKDFEEFFRLLNENRVQYLVVGGYAFAVHAKPRYTKDLDIFLDSSIHNAKSVVKTLQDFGFSSLELNESDFQKPNKVIQLGFPPYRIDLLTSIEGVAFDEAWPNKITANYGDENIYIIGRNDLIKNKESTGRPQDQLDAESLRKKET